MVLLAGCAGIAHHSFEMDGRILVKVPRNRMGEPVASTNSANGRWQFMHVIEVLPNSEHNYKADWYMVWTNKPQEYRKTHTTEEERRKRRPLQGHSVARGWKAIHRLTPELASVVSNVFGSYPTVIEPGLVFKTTDHVKRKAPSGESPGTLFVRDGQAPSVATPVQVRDGYSSAWPVGEIDGKRDPLWYQGTNYTELSAARDFVAQHSSGHQIRIGILDNGFDQSHVAMPSTILQSPNADALDLLDGEPLQLPGEKKSPHGTGTLSLLAGREVSFSDGKGRALGNGVLGAAPQNSIIVPACISPWVMSFTTVDLAYGIDYASRVRACDVISMSHGGVPALIWADAVNSAYDRGTAMFAACGDFFEFVLFEFPPPTAMFPAAFRRVLGVTGVTAKQRSYAKNDFLHFFANPLAWAARGSYGADLQRYGLFGLEVDPPDESQILRNGYLRPHPLAAYSPNVPWAVASADGGPTNLIDLDGSGTSASTPQVAGAAALWLQMNYEQIEKAGAWTNGPNAWKKAEAVYCALLLSAKRADDGKPDPYLGAGILKARRALDPDYDFDHISAMRNLSIDLDQKPWLEPDDQTNPVGFGKATHDFYDSQRAAHQVLLPTHQKTPSLRAALKQNASDFWTRGKALVALIYNELLLERIEFSNPSVIDQQRLEYDAKTIVRKAEEAAQRKPISY